MSRNSDSLSSFALIGSDAAALPLSLVSRDDLPSWLSGQGDFVCAWVESSGFTAEPGQVSLLPDRKTGAVAGVVVGVDEEPDIWALGGLPLALPRGLACKLALSRSQRARAESLALGWALGSYRFARYLSGKPSDPARLVVPDKVEAARLENLAASVFLVRDLINTPANDLGPEELVQVGLDLAKRYKGKATVIRGEKLAKDFPAIYAVGCGSERPPLLLDLRWGPKDAPKLTLVGKGVVFDTGGYDIKPSAGMITMKKDMGGAAHTLGLARLVMAAGLKVCLRVLVPAVENSISGHAMRPSDIIRTRSGRTVEIGNTDAEGRVILADALFEACRDKPDWLLDFATLTGARNVALGTEVPVLFSNDDGLAKTLQEASQAEQDPLWRLPLWQPYLRGMKSRIADLNNTSSAGGNAGAITAALFLEQFVAKGQSWAHFDFNAYNTTSQPGRPEGGEAMALRACFAAVERQFPV